MDSNHTKLSMFRLSASSAQRFEDMRHQLGMSKRELVAKLLNTYAEAPFALDPIVMKPNQVEGPVVTHDVATLITEEAKKADLPVSVAIRQIIESFLVEEESQYLKAVRVSLDLGDTHEQ